MLDSAYFVYHAASTAVLAALVVHWLRAARTLVHVVFAASFALVVLFVCQGELHGTTSADPPWIDGPSLIKILCELPLGLGSLLVYTCCLDEVTRAKYRRSFAHYVNAAVVGNIVMMVAVPDGGAWRGVLCKVACIALSVWLVLEMIQVGWVDCVSVCSHTPPAVLTELGARTATRTPRPSPPQHTHHRHRPPPLFLFKAAPLAWVLAHAAYRSVLVTLPAFDSFRHTLLECCSLALMCILRWYFARRCTVCRQAPVSHFFGMTDTLVVAGLGSVSQAADHLIAPSRRPLAGPIALDPAAADNAGAAVLCVVILVAVRHSVHLLMRLARRA